MAFCGIPLAAALPKSTMWGHLLESFAVNELRKMATWSKTRADLYRFRMNTGRETDLVLQDPQGRVAGIEVMVSASTGHHDLAGLSELRNAAGANWARGIVLHAGTAVTPFSKDLHAIPMTAPWHR